MAFLFERFASDHGIEWQEKRGWKQFHCPFCKGSGPYLGYQEESEAFHCWKCGNHSKKETMLALSQTAWADLCKAYFTHSRPSLRKEKEVVRQKVLEFPKSFKELQPIHKKYLRKRRFDPEILARQWDLKGTGHLGVWSYRIAIPVVYNGDVVSYTTRDITDKHAERYMSCKPEEEVLPIKSVLYGHDYCFDQCVLVEGPADVWRLGFGSLCSFGTGVTEAQIKLLKEFKKVFIIFDEEAEGVAEEVAGKLAIFTDVEIIDDIGASDPGELDEEDAKALMAELLG